MKQYPLTKDEVINLCAKLGITSKPPLNRRELTALSNLKRDRVRGKYKDLRSTEAEPVVNPLKSSWTSHAEWPKGSLPIIGDKSEDTHATEEDAKAVCDLLQVKGFGGDGDIFPIKTWVERNQ